MKIIQSGTILLILNRTFSQYPILFVLINIKENFSQICSRNFNKKWRVLQNRIFDVVFSVRKSVVTVFSCLYSPNISLVFTNWKDSGAFLGLVRPCSLVNGTWECLVVDFMFLPKTCFLCVFQ